MYENFNDAMLTTEEVCQFLRIKKTVLYRMIKEGEISGIKIGSQYRFSKKYMDKWYQEKMISETETETETENEHVVFRTSDNPPNYEPGTESTTKY